MQGITARQESFLKEFAYEFLASLAVDIRLRTEAKQLSAHSAGRWIFPLQVALQR